MKENMVLLIRFLCLLASNFGYYNLLRKKTKLDISFLPIVTIGIQVSILFIAGILNVLLPVAATMLIAGVILFSLDVVHKKVGEYLNFAAAPYAYMILCLITLILCLQGSRFSHFDDFSHWATVVQEMLCSNSYPNFLSWPIYFRTYPLGSSSYLYYCCLIAGTEEGTQMIIQAFMIVCTIMPLFSCAQKHRLFVFAYLLIFTNFVLVYNVKITCLQVDSLLPLFGMGAFIIIWNLYKEIQRSEESFCESDIWAAAPLLITTVMIKNSGIFFALPSIMILFVLMIQKRQERIRYAAILLSPGISIALWMQHCRYVFPDAMSSKHTVSISNYAAEFLEKSVYDIEYIARNLFDYVIKHPAFWAVLIITLILVVVSCMSGKKYVRKSIGFFMLIFCMYVLYSIGLCGMYIFSMPGEEGKYINEVSRYMGTIDIASFYLITAYILSRIDGLVVKKTATAVFVSIFAVLLLMWGYLAQGKIISGEKNPLPRMLVDERIQQYNIPIGAACAIANSENLADYYLEYIIRYLILSDAIYHTNDFEEDLDKLKNSEYLFMFDYKDDALNEWIRDNYPEQYGNDVIVMK